MKMRLAPKKHLPEIFIVFSPTNKLRLNNQKCVFFFTTAGKKIVVYLLVNMTRFVSIAVFLLFGLLMIPTNTYACESKSENIENTCSKQTDTKKTKEKCCDTKKEHSDKHGRECNGKCDNPACQCPSTCTSCIIPLFYDFLRVQSIVSKPNYHYQDTYYLSDFIAIWQPPKIS